LVTQSGTEGDLTGGVVHAVPEHVRDTAGQHIRVPVCSRCATADARATLALALPAGPN